MKAMIRWGRATSATALMWVLATMGCAGTISGGGDDTVAGLRFLLQPQSSSAAGAAFTVSVELLNSSGQKIGAADDVVTLTLSGGASLSGGSNSVAAVDGVATFSGLSITKSGTGYTITASANGANTSSTSFSVSPGPASASNSSVTLNPSSVLVGATIAATFTFRDQYQNALAGKAVSLGSALTGITFTPPTGVTNASGVFTTNFVASAAGNGTLTATVDGVQISLTSPITVTAPVQYTIATSASPSNGGTTTGGGTFNAGAPVTVTATPANGFTFANWTENGVQVSTSSGYSFTATSNRALVANFTPPAQFTITTSSNPANGGTTTGGGTYNAGASVTVTATPASGFAFDSWTQNGTQVSAAPSFNFTATANRALVANFVSTATPCDPITIVPPATTNGAFSGSSCTVGGLRRVTYRFTASGQGLSVFELASTVAIGLGVTHDPPSPTSAYLGFGGPTAGGTWMLPPGSYLVNVDADIASSGAFTLTSSTPGDFNACYGRVLLPFASVAVSAPLAATDCVRNDGLGWDGRFFDLYWIFSPGACSITLESTAFDPYLHIVNARTGAVIAFNDDSNGLNSRVDLPVCHAGGDVLAVWASSFAIGGSGAYVLGVSMAGEPGAGAAMVMSARPAPSAMSRLMMEMRITPPKRK